MPSVKLFFSGVICAMVLAGCGGGNATGNEIPAAFKTLQAGQSITLAAGQTVNVPAGTTVQAGTNTINISGNNNKVSTSAGAVVTVSTSAQGPADNTVTAR